MPLTDAEVDWVSRHAALIGAEGGVESVTAGAEAFAQAREAELKTVRDQIALLRAEIDAAQAGLELVDPRTITDVLLRRENATSWRDADAEGLRADSEVETREITSQTRMRVDGEVLDPRSIQAQEAVAKLHDAQGRLVALQEHMRGATDASGAALFSDDDIRQELWTPLVREGVLPDNAVSDEFSEQAQAFGGAVDLYKDQLLSYSEGRSAAGDFGRGAADLLKTTAQVSGSFAQGLVAFQAFGDLQADAGETWELQAKKFDPTRALTSEEKDRLSTLTKQNKELAADIARKQAAIGAITTLSVVGIDSVQLVVTLLTDEEARNWSSVADKVISMVVSSATAAIDIWNNDRATGNADKNKLQDAQAKALKLGITAVYCGGKVGTRLVRAKLAKTNAEMWAELDAALNEIPDGIQMVFDALSQEAKSRDEGEASAELALWGSRSRAIIMALKSSRDLARALRAGNSGEAAAVLGFGILSATMTLGGDVGGQAIIAADEGDLSDEKLRNLKEDAINRATAKALEPIAAETIARVTAETTEDRAMAALITDKMREADERAAAEALTALEDDAWIADLDSEVEAELLGVQETYAAATPNLDGATPEEIADANRAISEAMSQAEKLKAQQNLFWMVIDGGMAALTLVYPGASILSAAKDLVKAIKVWDEKAKLHNAWVDVQTTALAAQSGASAAMGNAVHNAKVHKTKATVDGVYSVLNAGTKVMQSFDPSGTALAVSGGVTMAKAVTTTIGRLYTMNDVRKGWNAYEDALEDPANRKLARQALRLNSTLAKCCIGYAAAVLNDAAAKQAVTMSGLSIAAIQNDKDICVRLVAYLQAELKDDPDVLKVVSTTDSNWYPGPVELSLGCWKRFVKAAERADPPLSSSSLDTPGIDRLLSELAKAEGETVSLGDDAARSLVAAQLKNAQDRQDLAIRLKAAFDAYAPFASGDGGGAAHQSMKTAANAFALRANEAAGAAQSELTVLERRLEAMPATPPDEGDEDTAE